MNTLINHLSEKQIEKLSKKNKNLLIEFQKEIHNQKLEYYDQLRRFYWVVSFILFVSFFSTMMIMSARFLLIYTIVILAAFIIALIGGKLFYIDKVDINKKAIAKSKFLDAMEIETLNPEDFKRKQLGLYHIIASGLLLLIAIIIIVLK